MYLDGLEKKLAGVQTMGHTMHNLRTVAFMQMQSWQMDACDDIHQISYTLKCLVDPA